MKRFLCISMWVCACVCVCVLQVIKVTQYLGHFKSKFDAVKNKVGLLLEKIKTSIPQPISVYPPFLVSQMFQV